MKSNSHNGVQHQEPEEQLVDQEEIQEDIQTSLDDTTQLSQCQQELAKIQQECLLWKDQSARIFADFDNYKKRIDKERVQWMQTAQISVLKDLLSVVDNFDRALSSKTAENQAMYAGIEMIYKAVVQLLNKHGVKEFAEYKEFDPEFHEALMDIESADHQTGQIVQVLEKGFMVKDVVLRPAKVTIAK